MTKHRPAEGEDPQDNRGITSRVDAKDAKSRGEDEKYEIS
jgi:hypothetical protein